MLVIDGGSAAAGFSGVAAAIIECSGLVAVGGGAASANDAC